MTGRLGGVGGGEADRHWQSITIRRARIFEEFLCKNTWVGAYFFFVTMAYIAARPW
jgi:preprotein translocase subunit SecG